MGDAFEVFVKRERARDFAIVFVDPGARVASLKKAILAELLLDKTVPLDETTLWKEGAAAFLDGTSFVRDVMRSGARLIVRVPEGGNSVKAPPIVRDSVSIGARPPSVSVLPGVGSPTVIAAGPASNDASRASLSSTLWAKKDYSDRPFCALAQDFYLGLRDRIPPSEPKRVAELINAFLERPGVNTALAAEPHIRDPRIVVGKVLKELSENDCAPFALVLTNSFRRFYTTRFHQTAGSLAGKQDAAPAASSGSKRQRGDSD
jgi:hypothetical protein